MCRLEYVCIIDFRGNGGDRVNWVQICSGSAEERVIVNTIHFNVV